MGFVGLSESGGAFELVFHAAGFRFSHPFLVFCFRPEKQSDTGQILTLRRDSSMADRRALSLSFFKKPCGRGRDRQTRRRERMRRVTNAEGERNRDRKQEILARTLRTKLSRDKPYAESSRGTDLAGAPSFALREMEAASQFSILFFLCPS